MSGMGVRAVAIGQHEDVTPRPWVSPGLAVGAISLFSGALLWEVAARAWFTPSRFPALTLVAAEAVELFHTGALRAHVGASIYRIGVGFALGSAVGMAFGMAMGSLRPVQRLLDPVINFLRFIPTIAWISPFLIWFGIGETSKILIIAYTVTFMVMLNTLAGVLGVHRNKVRLAQSFGASRWQIFRWVVAPSSVPWILTGMRIGMANAFTTVVTAEMLAAQAGLGYLILVSKNYGAADAIFLGMIVLGLLGLLADRLFVAITGRLARRFTR